MTRLRHALYCFVPAIAILTGASCTSNAPTTPTLSTPVLGFETAPAACGGGPPATAASMNSNATVLANLINGLRVKSGQPVLTPSAIDTGVGQWHANDMSAHSYIGLIGSDGEDVFRRITCSGGGGDAMAIAVGYSTDPNAVFAALQQDSGARDLLVYTNFFFGSSFGIGYSNGYWMIVRNK